MLFNSLHFLLFLPVVVCLYYLLPQRYRWMLIFTASCYFYMALIPKYILILFLIILIDYFSALAIEKSQGKKRRLWLILSLCSNILLLAFFKYFNFLNDNFQTLFALFGQEFKPVNLNILLPIGLSFHTFQSMSYTIEVYRGTQKAEKHIGYFANYVLFFPQMVAGPIERYDRLGNELKKEHNLLYKNITDGLKLILYGLFVKMAVADNLAPFVNQIYESPEKYTSFQVAMAVFLFSFQIYADFFGYSTIAVGSARMLGVNIMDNFKTPYLSRSISEFWTRWHISLSTWFRDYLYIPLGGNRVPLPRWSLNIMIVFMVSGLWHGANWTFVVWGALHGIMSLSERYFSKIFNFKIKNGWSFLNVILCLKTFIVTSFIWIFFRAENFSKAKAIIRALFKNCFAEQEVINFTAPLAFTALLIIGDLLLFNSRFELRLNSTRTFIRWTVYALLIFCLFALSGTQKFAFIYFQF
ncbi:MAG: MBOAT family protein [Bacteroidia bacterium]|nr:MBOAT family protein [Bacteroidia bacterium]